MKNIENAIIGSEKLTDIFGYWPTFHDAEIIELYLCRGDIEPKENRYIFPSLSVKMEVWEWTKKVDSGSSLIPQHQTSTTLKFHNLEDFQMDSFDYQNAIFELSISMCQRTDSPSLFFDVHFKPGHGMNSSFKCSKIEVINANLVG